MSADVDLADLEAPISEALLSAYERGREHGRREGHKDGYAAAVASFVATVNKLNPDSSGVDFALPAGDGAQQLPTTDPETPASTRAPRGALDPLLDAALEASPGMTTQEVEKAVLEADDRIAIKSIYNRLRFWEKQGKRFRRPDDGRWYRVQDLPAPWAAKGSPNGETGAVAAPASFDL